MHPVEARLREFRENLRRPEVPVILAVSGGADSVALLRAWHRTGSHESGRTVVAHFNHQWRGIESDQDEAFVRELADHVGWTCESGRASDFPAEPTGGRGPEAAARQQRYAFFARVARQYGARYLLTAHTADDQVETILLRIVRGTGIRGLAGMRPFRRLGENLTLARPLLEVSRIDLRVYLAELQQTYREDTSNSQLRFARNRVRHRLLPLLRTRFNEHIDRALQQLGEAAQASFEAQLAVLNPLWDQVVGLEIGRGVRLNAGPLTNTPCDLVRQLFVELWSRQGWPARDMNRSRWDELAAMLSAAAAGEVVPARMFPGGLRATIEQGQLVIRPSSAQAGSCTGQRVAESEPL